MNGTPRVSSWPAALVFMVGTTGVGSYGYHAMTERFDAMAASLEAKCQLRLEKVTADIGHIAWRVDKLEARRGSQ